MRCAAACTGLMLLSSWSCTLDQRQLAVADDTAEETASEMLAPAPTNAATPGSGAAGASAVAPSSPVTGCGAASTSPCECNVGAATTCGAEHVTTGVCAARVLVCQAPGVWPPASACAPMGPELCEPGALDDDCDGQVDEDCACINGSTEACDADTLRACADGAWGPCECEADTALDSDRNGVADSAETLLANGTFTSDLSGWVQSQVAHSMVDGVLFEHANEDATQIACSGSMLLVSWESTGDNFAEQCVVAGPDTYVASARVLLVANTGAVPRSAALSTTDVDPAVVSLELAASSSSDCQGAPLLEEAASTALDPALPSWQLLTLSARAPAGTQSLRLRIRVVADTPTGGDLQFYGLRSARWDDVVLRVP